MCTLYRFIAGLWNLLKLVDITFLPNPYKEEEDIIIHRVTEKEIEEASPEIDLK